MVYPASATVGSNILSLALENGVVIDRSNLKNLVDGDSTTGSAPKLVLALDEVPAAGATGSMMVAMTLMENDDQSGTYESSERKLTATVTVEWASDGANVVMTVPSGTASLSYEHNGNGYALSGANATADVFTFNATDGYSNTPASIEVRALDFFAAAVASAVPSGGALNESFTGLNLGSFFDGANNYYISVDITGTSNFFYQPYSDPIFGITANITLGEAPGRFNLHRVGLLDYIDGIDPVVYALSPTVADGKMSLTMNSSNVVDLSNLKSLADEDNATGKAPRLLLVMDSVPASGESGSMNLTVSLVNGLTGVRAPGERSLSGSITANWSADAKGDITVKVPAQSALTLTYTSDSGTTTATGANGAEDMITLSQSKAFENFPATLEVRVLDWFNAALKSAPEKFTGLNLADFFKAGNYNVNVAIDQGADKILYYQRASNPTLLTSLDALIRVGEAAAVAGSSNFDVEVDDWSTTSTSPVELHVIYPIGATRQEIRLHPALNGTTMEFDFGSNAIKKAHINELLNGTNEGNELVPALQFKLAEIANASGAFKLRMTVTSGADGTIDPGGLQMESEVDITYSGDGARADFTVPTQTQNVTVTDGSICQTGCTFTLASTEEILEVASQGATYPPTLSAKLISLFDLNLAGRNAETTVKLQKGDFHLMIEVLPAAGGSASDVDDILTYGGLPITKVEGIIKID